MSLQPLKAGQLVAGRDGVLHPDLVRWMNRLTSIVNTGAVPAGTIVLRDIPAADVTGYFDATGLGIADGPYDGWAVCNGSNGTPNLSDKFPRISATGSGGTGGTDDSSHTHDIDHTHASETVQSGAGADVATEAFTGTSGAASATDNRPAYYELVALMRLERDF